MSWSFHLIWPGLYAGTEKELHKRLVKVLHLWKKCLKAGDNSQTKGMSTIHTSRLRCSDIKMLQKFKISCQNTLISPFAPQSQYCFYYPWPSTDLIYSWESHSSVEQKPKSRAEFHTAEGAPSFSQLLQGVRCFGSNFLQMPWHTTLQACCQLFVSLAIHKDAITNHKTKGAQYDFKTPSELREIFQCQEGTIWVQNIWGQLSVSPWVA